MKFHKYAPLYVALLLAVVSCGCNKLRARDQLNKGVSAYRNAQFQQAITNFQNAVVLDARLYLATAYAQQYIPGGDSAENNKTAEQAINAFQDVLKMDPSNVTAIAYIAQIYYGQKNFDKAKEYQQRRMQIEPNNPEPYYWIGVLNWAVCIKRTAQVRKDLKIDMPKDPVNHPNDLPLIPEKQRSELADENGQLVSEGIAALEKAIQIKPNYAEAIEYLNLMYRQKAEIESDEDARQADVKRANDLMDNYVAVQKAAATAPAPTGGITQ